MEITLGVIFVFIFVSSRLPSVVSVYSLSIKTATFQMLQQHPQLTMCIESVLHEDQYVGCRVFELTGQCQGLIRSWGLNQTIEQGYAYAEKVVVEESFQQSPLTLSRVPSIWRIPVVLHTGARIDISMSTPNWARSLPGEVLVMDLTNGSSTLWYREEEHWIMFQIMDKHITITEKVAGTEEYNVLGTFKSDELPSPFRSKERFTISFLAQSNSLAVFVEDEEVTAFNLTADTRMMRQLSIHRSHKEVDPIFIHGIKFTGK